MALSLRRSRVACAVAPALCAAACGATPGGPRVSEEPARLEFIREWLRPDLTPETEWVTYPRGLVFDRATGHLFFQDRDWKTIVEITEAGDHVRSYGSDGEGPGELGHASGVAIDADHVYALDNGNLKIVAFRRSDAEVALEFRIGTYYRDLTILEDGRIMVAPGMEQAVDILDREGRIVGGLGRRSDIPGGCTGCAIARLPDGRVAVLDGDRPEMFVFEAGAPEPAWFDLYSLPLMVEWREEVAANLRRIQRMGGGRIWMWRELDVAGPSRVTVSVGPPGIMETGLELWRIDVDTGDVERYHYGEPGLGYSLAIHWPRVFTVRSGEGVIVEYRAPEGEEG